MKKVELFDTELWLHHLGDGKLLLQSIDEPSISFPRTGEALNGLEEIDEVVACQSEILIYSKKTWEELEDLISKVKIGKKSKNKIIEISVCFHDHPDWKLVLQSTGKSKDEIIDQICNTEFTIGMYGFVPGFFYLDGLTSDLHIPRKEKPVDHIRAGSLAMGGQYLGVYGSSTPGGWYVLGSTDWIIRHKSKKKFFNIGDIVKFKQVTLPALNKLLENG